MPKGRFRSETPRRVCGCWLLSVVGKIVTDRHTNCGCCCMVSQVLSSLLALVA